MNFSFDTLDTNNKLGQPQIQQQPLPPDILDVLPQQHKQPPQNLNSGVNNQNDINKKFTFHNPFDFHSYPITNPPIFDSTTMLPYTTDGIPRRRRISISNGQIGQIVNHDALFEKEDLDSSLDQDIIQYKLNEFEFNSNNDSNNDHNNHNNHNIHNRPQTTPFMVDFQPPVQQNQNHQNQQQIPPTPIIQQQQQQQQQIQQPQPQTLPPQAPPEIHHSDVAGVPPPNHQLIYNNEVIYNPENGPIPGTAAWKKERLLERNRVAAFKCRQRKKQAQMQLQDSVNKLETELKEKNEKLNKLELLLNHYKSTINLALKNGDYKKLEELV
ncbi:unnamed protein product [Candida verbasci]|uniref:BZIP domain-containing protein n=1 Tax=Candida verbasci TaxID=1227364 RepID=A0A9W4TT03_9ASCO|nr:unnamed protein product [Candida verbasci]